jgi:hypothetical protein
MEEVEQVLGRLDVDSAGRVRRLLAPLLDRGRSPASLSDRDVLRLLTESAPATESAGERHETAWALADFFDAGGLPRLAGVCRDQHTHERLSALPSSADRRRLATGWTEGLQRGSRRFWADVLAELRAEPVLPVRLELALTPVRALMEAVADGVPLTSAGYLPPTVALGLDATFGWSDEHNMGRPRGERDLPPLLFLREHLEAQGLLTRDGRTLAVPETAARLLGTPPRLWTRVADPRPRWSAGFEEDAVAVLAVTLVRSTELTRDQLRDEMVDLLSGKWQGRGTRTVEDGVRDVELAWFRLGITMGWWDREGGIWSAKVRLGAFGRAAAASAFWSVAGRPRGRTKSVGSD